VLYRTPIERDHSKSTLDFLNNGIKVYALKETHEAIGTDNHHNARFIELFKKFKTGSFEIVPFDVQHDVPTVGFLIKHEETGLICFATDTYYISYTFPKLNNIMIEANYAKDIIDQRLSEQMFLRDRVLQSHFSLDNCKDFLKANDLSAVNQILILHLSDRNSDEKRFKKEVEELTGKTVHVAVKGLEIEFNKTPF
jgi:phosphoribosyl 1,2-cyclic phosphodiesterase